MSMMPQVSLERLLEGVDWSRCSGRELHRLAEGAAQAAARRTRLGEPMRALRLHLMDLANPSPHRRARGTRDRDD